MALTFNMDPEQYVEKILYPGIASLFRDLLRKKLQDEADRIVKEALEELPLAVVKGVAYQKNVMNDQVNVTIQVTK